MKIRVTARAAEQVRAVDAWWREHRGGTGFLDDFSQAVEHLMSSPDLGAVYEPKSAFGVRRLLLANGEYYLYYVHRRDRGTLRIIAVWSCYRGRKPALGSLTRT